MYVLLVFYRQFFWLHLWFYGKGGAADEYELKITLPIYKIVYSIAFMVIIVLVSPINSFSGIITAVEPNVALLAGVFMADNYYKEYVGERVLFFTGIRLEKNIFPCW